MLQLNRETVRNMIENGERPDGRSFDEFRDIEITPNYIRETAEGSALVRIGDTQVLAGVKFGTGTPYSDSPDEGVLMTGAELVPLASPEFESGPPSREAVELARVIDRGIRESAMIDLKELCIEEGEKIWMVNVDLHVIDNNGNLFDACALAAVAALLTAKVPKYDEENDEILRGEYQGDLPINCVPVTVTGARVAENTLVDLLAEEEEVLDTRLSVTFLEDGNVVSMQKSGNVPFSTDTVADLVDVTHEKSKKLREILESAVEA